MASVVPAINRLPAEILGYIWDLYLPDPTLLLPLITLHNPRAPWNERGHQYLHSLYVLARICRHWHALVLGFPHLWTYIETTVRSDDDALVQRSGTLPLSLATSTHTGIVVPAAARDRIYRVDLVVPARLLAQDFFRNLPTAQLKILTLWMVDEAPHRTAALPIILHGDVSALQALALRGPTYLHTPGPNLTHLCVFAADYSQEHLRRCLSHTPRLEVLHLESDLEDVSVNESGQNIRLPLLRSMTIATCSVSAGLAMLSFLHIPTNVSVFFPRVRPIDWHTLETPSWTDGADDQFSLEIVGPELHIRVEPTAFRRWDADIGGAVAFRLFSTRTPSLRFCSTFVQAVVPPASLHTLHISPVRGLRWIHCLADILSASPRLAVLVAACPRPAAPSSAALDAVSGDLFVALFAALERQALCPALATLGIRSASGFVLQTVARRFAAIAKTRERLGRSVPEIVVDPIIAGSVEEWKGRWGRAFAGMGDAAWVVRSVPRFGGHGLAGPSGAQPYWDLRSDEEDRAMWERVQW